MFQPTTINKRSMGNYDTYFVLEGLYNPYMIFFLMSEFHT